MTLHNTVEFARKFLLGVGVGVGALVVIFLILRLSTVVRNAIFPPKVHAPTVTFGSLPALEFPKKSSNVTFTYAINTVSGGLPQFPDRLNVYEMKKSQPSLLNLNKAKAKAESLNFKGENNSPLPEVALDSVNYEWREDTGLRRILKFNTVTFDFTLSSSYLSSITVLNAKELSNEENAIKTALSLLTNIEQTPGDVDPTDATTELLSITNSTLSPTTSLSKSQVIRVNLHQKDIVYDLEVGNPQLSGEYKKITITAPILYPFPPYSTMSFWIASGQTAPQVVAANYIYQTPDFKPDVESSYPIKTAEMAYEELVDGKAYIAAYTGAQNEIAIDKVYLAYYIGESLQEYLMPVIVFEGKDGFIAYVSAVSKEWIK